MDRRERSFLDDELHASKAVSSDGIAGLAHWPMQTNAGCLVQGFFMIANVACCCAGALNKGRVLLVCQAFAFFDRAITSMLMLAMACSYEPTLCLYTHLTLPTILRV